MPKKESKMELKQNLVNNMSDKYTIILACDATESEEFSAWLEQKGHDVSIGNSTGSYVDGIWTQHDENASEIMNLLWDEYCGS